MIARYLARETRVALLSLTCFCFSPTIWGYEVVSRQQFVMMDDGVKIDTTVRVPDSKPPENGWPALVLIHGLGASKNGLGAAVNPNSFTSNGYVTLAYSVRGQGESEGLSTLTGKREIQDLAFLKRWLEKNFPVDTAYMGVTGKSQGGMHGWGAVAGALGFAVAVPENYSARAKATAIINNGSIHSKLFGALSQEWVDPSARALLKHMRIYDTETLLAAFEVLWGESRVTEQLSATKCPVFAQHAFLDIWGPAGFSLKDYQLLENAKARKIYLGTGGHQTSPTDRPYRMEMRDRWLDYWLKGEENGILDEPKITFALLGDNEKISFDEFPHPRQRDVTWFLAERNSLLQAPPGGSQAPDSFVNDVAENYTIEKAFGDQFSPRKIAANVAESRLVYETSPLDKSLLVVGFPTVRLWVDGTASRYQVNVHLSDEGLDGEGRLLAYATCVISKANYPQGRLLELELTATGRRVRAGHRIRMTLTNLDAQVIGDKPSGRILRYIPLFEDNETSVFHDAARPSYLTLPVIEEGPGPRQDSTEPTSGDATCRMSFNGEDYAEPYKRQGQFLHMN